METIDELRVAVCENDPEECSQLILLIHNSGYSVQADLFESGEALLAEYRFGFYDLILMDIYMDGMSGVETVQAIRDIDSSVLVAFTTVSKDYALEGYRLDVAKYMEKPVAEKAVRDILKMAYEKRQNAPGYQLLYNGRSRTVPFGQILYVEQNAHALLLHMADGQLLRSRGKLNEAESCFPSPPYFRCHKSYLVNLAFVTGLDRELMIFRMRDGTNVHIRRESLKKARDAWEVYLFDMSRKAGTGNE